MAKSNVWTVEEDILLKKLWGIHSVDEIASIMKRHRLTILKKAKELGLRKSRSAKWSEEEIQFIIKHYPVKRVDWCSEKLGRSKRSVYTMAERLGLKVEWSYRKIDKDGYIILIFPNSTQLQEHRYVMERFLRRKLKSNEIVHHLDSNKQNNALENLILLTPALHNVLHALIKQKDTERLFDFANNLSLYDKPKYLKWLNTFCSMI